MKVVNRNSVDEGCKKTFGRSGVEVIKKVVKKF